MAKGVREMSRSKKMTQRAERPCREKNERLRGGTDSLAARENFTHAHVTEREGNVVERIASHMRKQLENLKEGNS